MSLHKFIIPEKFDWENDNLLGYPNTIFEIKYDFDLKNKTVQIPQNCTLKFEGGSFYNGKIFSDNKTTKIINFPPYDESNDFLWGKFFNSSGLQLTYKGDVINTRIPISIPLLINHNNYYLQPRKMGAVDFQMWIFGVWDETTKKWIVSEEAKNNFLYAINTYNFNITHIRLGFKIPSDNSDYVDQSTKIATTNSEQYISDFTQKAKDIIDFVKLNDVNEGVKYMFLSNETPYFYQNDNWAAAMTGLKPYCLDRGYIASIAHNRIGKYKENALSPVYVSDNFSDFDLYGLNFYTSISSNLSNSINKSINRNSFEYREALHSFKSNLNALEALGIDKIAITETGFSPSNKGFSTPDFGTGDVPDGSGYVQAAAFSELLELLKPFARKIEFINLWSVFFDSRFTSDEIEEFEKNIYEIITK